MSILDGLNIIIETTGNSIFQKAFLNITDRAKEMLQQARINPDTRIKDLTDAEVALLRDYIGQNFKVEGDLRREVQLNIKRLIEIGSYRGLRHRRNLPVRGQRTRTNAR